MRKMNEEGEFLKLHDDTCLHKLSWSEIRRPTWKLNFFRKVNQSVIENHLENHPSHIKNVRTFDISVSIVRGFNCFIEIKFKLLHHNKVTSLCNWIPLLYNNNIFHKNAFLDFKVFLKDIFEKCWHQYSCVVKMNSLSYLSIAQFDYFL